MNKFLIVASTIVMITITGCAQKAPTTGDFMRMHAAEEKAVGVDQKTLAKEWEKGSALKKSGEKLVQDGEKLIKDGDHQMTIGKQNIEQGNKDIAEGTKIMEESELKFNEAYPNLKLDLVK